MDGMEYIKNYVELHTEKKEYGASSIRMLDEISLAIDYLQPEVVLDYGCGKGAVLEKLQEKYPNIKFYGYDPAIPGRDILQVKQADLIINTDVLEHIPEEMIDDTLLQIASISSNVFFSLDHAEAVNFLPDGTNAHCTIKPLSWYLSKFDKYFSKQMVLPGRFPWKSVVLTFPLRQDLIKKYYKVTAIVPEQYSNHNFKLLVKSISLYAKRIDELERELAEIKAQLALKIGDDNNG